MGKLRQIAQLGAPILRQTAETINTFDNNTSLEQLVCDMQLTLTDSGGVGLAAPQIYESYRVMIIASRPTPRYPYAPDMPATIMINPQFTATSNVIEKDWEGCLSIPGIRAQVPRFVDIEVLFQNTSGQQSTLALSGFPARVFQHEFDHLNGFLYLDRVTDNRDIIAEKEFQKMIANRSVS